MSNGCNAILRIPGCDSNGFFPSFKARGRSKNFVAGNAPDAPDALNPLNPLKPPSDVNRLFNHVSSDKSLYFSIFNIPGCDSNGFFPSFKARGRFKFFVGVNPPNAPSAVNRL